uniref:Uncharacterized protein n=1 Tax=Catagonus wagneri TaxID=51154 RepID=A0A8C3YU93_9CETA
MPLDSGSVRSSATALAAVTSVPRSPPDSSEAAGTSAAAEGEPGSGTESDSDESVPELEEQDLWSLSRNLRISSLSSPNQTLATAPLIQPLAQELSYAAGVALKRKKRSNYSLA